MPAAESVTICDAVEVSDRAMLGIFWMNSPRDTPLACRLAAVIVGMPPASARNSTTFLARLWADNSAGASRIATSTFFMPESIGGGRRARISSGPCATPLALAPRTHHPGPGRGRHRNPHHAARWRRPGRRATRRHPRRGDGDRRRRRPRASGSGSTASNGPRATIRAPRRARRRAPPISCPAASAGARPARSSSGPRRPTAPRPSRACRSTPGPGRCGRGRPRARNIILFLGDGMGASHRTAARLVSRGTHNGKAAGPAGDGHAGGDRPGDDRVAECGDHRLLAGHGRLRDRPEERQQPGRRVPGQHRRLLRQPAHRVSRRDPAPHAAARVQRRHRDHRRPDRFDAGGQRRAHVEPVRGTGHRRAVLRRAQDQRRDGADGRRREPLLGQGGRRHAARRPQPARGIRRRRLSDAAQRHRCAGRHRTVTAGAQGHPRSVPPVAHGRRVRQGGCRPLQRRTGAREERGLSRHADARGHDQGGDQVALDATHRPAST